MQKLTRKERSALKWCLLIFALFWVAVIAFRIVLMATNAYGSGQFS